MISASIHPLQPIDGVEKVEVYLQLGEVLVRGKPMLIPHSNQSSLYFINHPSARELPEYANLVPQSVVDQFCQEWELVPVLNGYVHRGEFFISGDTAFERLQDRIRQSDDALLEMLAPRAAAVETVEVPVIDWRFTFKVAAMCAFGAYVLALVAFVVT